MAQVTTDLLKHCGPAKLTQIEYISLTFVTHVRNLSNSIYHLCLNGLSPAACIVARTVLESQIDFAYLWLCEKINGTENGTRERLAWMQYDAKQQGVILRDLMEENRHREKYGFPLSDYAPFERRDEILSAAEEFSKRYGNHWAKIKDLKARAIAVDKQVEWRTLFNELLESEYNIFYRTFSQLNHSSAATLKFYTDQVKNDITTINFRPTNLIVPTADMTTRSLFRVLAIANHLLRLGINLDEQLKASGYTRLIE